MPMIDLRTFLPDDNILIICKSIDGKGSQWIITDVDDTTTIEIEFGRIVLVWLNQINPIKPDGFNVIEQLIAEENSSLSESDVTQQRVDRGWEQHYDAMVEFIMNKKNATQDMLIDFYKKYRYFAHHCFSGLPFEEYSDVPKSNRKPSEIVGYTIINGQPYQIIRVYGFTNFFVLDLWEMLFNNASKYKIKQCKKCKMFFRTSTKNRDYCTDCQKLNEDYAEEYRNDTIHKLRKSILAKLNSNNKYKNEAGDRKIEKFKKDLGYYIEIVRTGTTNLEKPDDCNENIKTEEDLIKWLIAIEDEVRVYGKGESNNGKTAEKSKRNRRDHKGIGQTQEAISGDGNTGLG